MSTKKLLMAGVIFLFFAAFAQTASAATYYVDSVGGLNSNNGTATGTPWQTIAKVNSTSLQPGDTVLFKKGSTWRETLQMIARSGAVGNPITFGAYGTGANPIINGADLKTSWTSEAFSGSENFTDGTGPKPQSWYSLSEASGARADANTTNHNNLAQTGTGTISQSAGPNLTVANAATFTAASSQKLDIAGSSLSAGFPGVSTTTDNSVTFGGWFKVNSLSAVQGLMAKNESYGLFSTTDGRLVFNMFADGYGSYVEQSTAGGVAVAGQWAHVVGRWNQSTGAMTLFVNGTNASGAPTTIASMLHVDYDNFDLGYSSFTGGSNPRYLDGSLAEPFVFSGALSDAQIQSIYASSLSGSSATLYYTSVTTGDPKQVMEDGTRLTAVASKAALAAGTFWYDSANTRVYVFTRENDNPSGHTMEVSARDNDILLSSSQNITVTGLTLSEARDAAALRNDYDSSNNIVDGCIFENNYKGGFLIYSSPSFSTSGGTVRNSVFRNNGAWGIGVGAMHFTSWLFDSNDIYNNALYVDSEHMYSSGIKVFSDDGSGGQGTVISNNRVYNNGISSGGPSDGVGIWADTVTGVTVKNNIIYNNQGPGIELEKAINSSALNNVVYNNAHACGVFYGCGNIWVRAGEGLSSNGNLVANNTSYGGYWALENGYDGGGAASTSNNVFRNNIAVGAMSGVNFYAEPGGDNNGTSGTGNIYDHNNFGAPASGFVYWGGALSTYAALDAAYGSAMNNVSGDPLFTNAGTGNFTLQSASPARDSGAALGASYQFGLNPTGSWPSNVTTLNQYANGTGWELGAYVYIDPVTLSYALAGPATGMVNAASTNFTVTPTAPYTGTITVTPSGGGLSAPIVLTFSGSATPQTFTITPTAAGAVTLTPTNSGSLANPAPLSYAATAVATPPSTGGYLSGGGGSATAVPSTPITAPAQPAGCTPGDQFSGATGVPCASIPATPAPGASDSSVITMKLSLKMTNAQVLLLQQYLNAHGFTVAATGAGSPGHETSYFGPATRTAVMKWQKSNGLAADGIVGAMSRALIAENK